MWFDHSKRLTVSKAQITGFTELGGDYEVELSSEEGDGWDQVRLGIWPGDALISEGLYMEYRGQTIIIDAGQADHVCRYLAEFPELLKKFRG